MTHLLFDDKPARIQRQGTFELASATSAVYTVGADVVRPAIEHLLDRTTELACDIETFGLGAAGRRLKSVTFSDSTEAVLFDPRDPYQANLIRKTAQHCSVIIFYNSPFDVPNLYLNNLFSLEDIGKVEDPLLYTRLANPGELVRKRLMDACDRYMSTGKGDQLERAFKALGLSKSKGYEEFDLDRPIYLQGAVIDAILTHRVRPLVKRAAFDKLTSNHPFPRQGLSHDEAWNLVEREQIINRRMTLPRTCKGFRVDFEYADKFAEETSKPKVEAANMLKAHGLEPGKTPQLLKLLDARGEIPNDYPRTAKTNQPSGTAEDLQRLTSQLAYAHIRYKKIEHEKKDYIDKVIDLAINGRVYSQVNLLTAATGRSSMNDPPFHQFSAGARGILLADEGDALTSVDLSQGEPVTIANAAHDMHVLTPYEQGTESLYITLGTQSGMLPRGITKAQVEADKSLKRTYGMLKQALLAQLYGQGLPLLSAKLGLDIGPYGPPTDWEVEVRKFDRDKLYPRYHAAKQLRNAVFSAMPGTSEFIQKLKTIARQHRVMLSISGRVMDIPRKQFDGQWRVEAHKGTNYFCQGGQYDLMADAEIRIIEAGLQDAIYLMMHDEFVCSTSASRDIQKILQTPSERFCFWAQRTPVIKTDLKDLGERWADA